MRAGFADCRLQFQHTSYEEQLKMKHGFVKQRFQEAGITLDDRVLQPIIPSPLTYGCE